MGSLRVDPHHHLPRSICFYLFLKLAFYSLTQQTYSACWYHHHEIFRILISLSWDAWEAVSLLSQNWRTEFRSLRLWCRHMDLIMTLKTGPQLLRLFVWSWRTRNIATIETFKTCNILVCLNAKCLRCSLAHISSQQKKVLKNWTDSAFT